MRRLAVGLAALLAASAAWGGPAPLFDLDDPQAVRALLDDTMRRQLARGFSPGAAVAVVKDGRVVLLRGYGVADLASGRPVDPATTVFRVGSVSKAALAVPVVAIPLAGAIAVLAVSSWRRRWWGTAWRAYYTALAVGALAWPVFLFHWNLLGWRT